MVESFPAPTNFDLLRLFLGPPPTRDSRHERKMCGGDAMAVRWADGREAREQSEGRSMRDAHSRKKANKRP